MSTEAGAALRRKGIRELAAKLDGRSCGDEITKSEESEAKASGLVVVFGASDDLMELRGAIDDEVGCYEGGEAVIDRDGVIDNRSLDYSDEAAVRAHLRRSHGARKIKAIWDPGDGYSWVYSTDIPHETFDVYEDGEPYARGIVFSIDDIAPSGGEP
jgi:hypothetical protein